jgi:hypothetical protein
MMRLLLPIVVSSLLVACSSLMTSATSRMAGNLSTAILNQDDPETVRAGAPAYLLLIDSLISDNPDDANTLATGARLYSAYAGAFVSDPARAQRLAKKGFDYARRALCLQQATLCQAYAQAFDQFKPVLDQTTRQDVPLLYTFGSAWASWMQTTGGNWGAMADLPKVTAIMQRIVSLDEAYDHGGAHLYLGVFASQLPPSLGGKPELARQHFERAIALSKGQHLMVKVLYAKYYARLLYDQQLHDRLLKEVLAARVQVPGLTLMNTLAQQQARALLASGKDYF